MNDDIANDNVETRVPTDTECMETLSYLLGNRIQLGVGYLQEAEPGVLTHSVLTIKCGELYMQTEPTALPVYMMPVTPDLTDRVVN